MPRIARSIKESGYRHVIIRGIGKQILFEEDNDSRYFLNLLKRYSKETKISICAYCLMDNHVHLLLHDYGTDTSLFMKKVGVSYSAYYNVKYDRIGHLFQDRFKSENICDERYYLTALRYILRNPEKAGICRTDEYKWSSFNLYNARGSFIEQDLTRELLHNRNEYVKFILGENHDDCMEYENRKTDEWAEDVIRTTFGVVSGTVLQSYDRNERNIALRQLKEKGLSIRQIERLTGINRGVIQKA